MYTKDILLIHLFKNNKFIMLRVYITELFYLKKIFYLNFSFEQMPIVSILFYRAVVTSMKTQHRGTAVTALREFGDSSME